MLPSLSLITTTYNRAHYLPYTLDSILAQTHPHFDLLIWDDGSTDHTLAIAHQYAQRDSRIRVIAAEHQGFPRAIKGAIAATTGTYFGWVDSDDLLAPTALAETVAILDTQPHVGLVYTNHILIDEHGHDLGLGRQCRIPYHKDRLLVDFMIMHFRLLRRSVYEQVGGIDPTVEFAEDYDLCLKLSEVTDIHHLPQPLYYYRRHTGNVTNRQVDTIRSAHQAITNALQRRGLDQHYHLHVTPTFSLRPQPSVQTLPTPLLAPLAPAALEPLVSIIIPAYNAAPRLRFCLHSVLNQTYPNLEIILVDNGSTDDTVAIAQSLAAASTRPFQILHCLQRGANHARNFGFTHAQGDYIQWLDADDDLAPDKITQQVIALVQQPAADIAYGDWDWCFWQDRQLIAQLRFADRVYDDFTLQTLLDNWRPPHAYLLRRRAALRLHQLQAWHPDTTVYMDREYFTLAALLGLSFLHVPDSFVCYHRWSTTQVSRRATYPDRIHNRRQIFRRLQDIAQVCQGHKLTRSHLFLLHQNWELWQPNFTLVQQADATFALQHHQRQETLPLTWQEANIARAYLTSANPQVLADQARAVVQYLWLELLTEQQQGTVALNYDQLADQLAWRLGCSSTPSTLTEFDTLEKVPSGAKNLLVSQALHPLLQEVPLFTPLFGEERFLVQQFLERLRQANWLLRVEPTAPSQALKAIECTAVPKAVPFPFSLACLPTPNAVITAKRQPTRGVLYCAVSDRRYLEAALISAIALRQLEPDLPITLLSDCNELHKLKLEPFNLTVKWLEIPPEWRQPNALESRLVKTSLPAFTPYEQTLYLDADILPLQAIAPIWDYLTQAKVGLVVDRTPTIGQCDHIAQPEKDYTLQFFAGTLPQYNGGMMLWESSAAALKLFSTWKQEWLRFKQQDQLALIRAIQITQTEVIELPNHYNFPLSQWNTEVVQPDQVRLLHCIGGLIPRRQYQQVAQTLLPKVVATVQALLQASR